MKKSLLLLVFLLTLLFSQASLSYAILSSMNVSGVVGCHTRECDPVYEDAVVKRNEYLLLYVQGYQPSYYSDLQVRFSGYTSDKYLVKPPIITNDSPYQGLYEVLVQVPDDISLDEHTVQLVYKGETTNVVDFSVIPNGAPTPTPNPSASPTGGGTPPGPVTSPTPIGSPNVPTVASDLTCVEQGLVKDNKSGLCVPKNPYAGEEGSLVRTVTVGELIKKILNVLLLMCGAVAVLMIVIGGYQFITSRGSEDQAKTGRKTITYAVMGIAAALLAYMMVTVVINFVTKGSPF